MQHFNHDLTSVQWLAYSLVLHLLTVSLQIVGKLSDFGAHSIPHLTIKESVKVEVSS